MLNSTYYPGVLELNMDILTISFQGVVLGLGISNPEYLPDASLLRIDVIAHSEINTGIPMMPDLISVHRNVSTNSVIQKHKTQLLDFRC
jgi:hypothetical protein